MARPGGDPAKVEALRSARSLHRDPDGVRAEHFLTAAFLDPRDLVQVKYELVRHVRIDGVTVRAAAAAFGLSRPTFYAAAAALETGGVPALLPRRPGPRAAHRLTPEVTAYVESLVAADPSVRSADLAAAITERFGVRVHPRSIERALERRRRQRTE